MNILLLIRVLPIITGFKQWMSTLTPASYRAEIPFRQWILPGTHDTASYCSVDHHCTVREPYIRPIVSLVCDTQRLNITQQILHGVRFFDVRAGYVRDKWVMVHGVCSYTTTLYTLLAQSLDTMRIHNLTGEIFVYDIRTDGPYGHFDNHSARRMIEDITTVFESYRDVATIYPWDDIKHLPYDQIVRSLGNVIVCMVEPTVYTPPFTDRSVVYRDNWDSSVYTVPDLFRYVDTHRHLPCPVDNICTIQLILNQNPNVWKSLWTVVRYSDTVVRYHRALHVNERVLQYINNTGLTRGRILLFNDFDPLVVMPYILHLNTNNE